MNEQIGAAPAAAQAEDAWDRLAALAFGGGGAASGCSEHAHEFDCACEPPVRDARGCRDCSEAEMEIAD